MILEKNGRRGLDAMDSQYYQSPRLRIGHVSTAAVFSEYESFEWLFRETYKKAGCYVLGAKLLQFFETPKFL